MHLPARDEMLRALNERDTSYEGVFVTAITTTGIFCRPGCPARQPRPENVRFFPHARDALSAGFRPCKRCKPMEPAGEVPPWLREVLARVEASPSERVTDADLRGMGIEPARVRRWFRAQHGMTFHAYHRARRLGRALGHLHQGRAPSEVAQASGYESESGFREAFARWFESPPGKVRGERVLHVERLLSPLGPLVAVVSDQALLLLEFSERRGLETQVRQLQKRLSCRFALGRNSIVDELEIQLAEYFAGERRGFDLSLEMPGTDFQRAAWDALLAIPYGETRSYQDQARAIGRPAAVRAIGRANGMNRIAILVPCHRVIQADGSLSGYGGGLWRKRWLLDHEHEHALSPAAVVSETAVGSAGQSATPR